jgi:hypothetical protein
MNLQNSMNVSPRAESWKMSTHMFSKNDWIAGIFFIKLRSLVFRITYDKSNARNYYAIVVIE